MNEWNIQSRGCVCSDCETPFEDGALYHTALFEEAGLLQRHDVCGSCWATRGNTELRVRDGFVSCWQGVYEVPPPPNAEPIQKENAESLLRKLVELDDPRYIPAGYILAVMLERKRLLKVKEELERDGQRVFVYEQPRTGDVFAVVDPQLQLDQLETVQREVSQLLEHGLNAAAMEESEADETGGAAIAATNEPGLPSEPAVRAD